MPLPVEHSPQRPKAVVPLARRLLCINELPPQVREVATLRGLGLSANRIGKMLGIPRCHVEKLLTSHRRPFRSLPSIVGERKLSSRAVNSLGLCGILSVDDALGRGFDNVLQALQALPNCGERTRNEIVGWMQQHASDAHAGHAAGAGRGESYSINSPPAENASSPAIFASGLRDVMFPEPELGERD